MFALLTFERIVLTSTADRDFLMPYPAPIQTRRVLAGFGLSVALTTTLAACSTAEPPVESALDTPAERVRIASVEPAPGASQLAFPGTTRASDGGDLAFQTAGRLARRLDIGEAFEQGDVLATLDNPRLQPGVDAARQRVEQLLQQRRQAERDLARVQALGDRNAATTEEVEQVRSRLAALKAAEAAARAQQVEAEQLLGESRMTAPYAGTVTRSYVDPGEFVPAGTAVLAVAGSGSQLEIEIVLPESLILSRQPGESIPVRLPLLDRTVQGQVVEIANAAAGAGRLFPLVVSLPAATLRAGLTAEVVIPVARQDELTVPLRAVVDPGSHEPHVYRLAGDRAERVAVRVGDLLGERIVVSGALQAGDSVITAGLTRLIDGQTVDVLR